MLGVRASGRVGVRRLVQGHLRELADRVRHAHAPIAPAPHEALQHERLEQVEIASTHSLGCLDREAPSERGEPAEEALLLVA
jgi:hypothetical protein